MIIFSEEALCIRQATLDDTQYIAKIKIENHQHENNDHPLDQMMNAVFMREYIKRYDQHLKDGICTLILSIHDQITGFISYTACPAVSATAEIKNIYLKPEDRGGKLGKLLLNAALDKIRDEQYRKVIVWLVEGRSRTTRFYEAAGFVKTESYRMDVIRKDVIVQENLYQMLLT